MRSGKIFIGYGIYFRALSFFYRKGTKMKWYKDISEKLDQLPAGWLRRNMFFAMMETGAFISGVIGVYRSGYQGIDALFFLCITLMYVAVQAVSRVRHVIDVLTNDAVYAQCVSPSKTRAEVKIEKSEAKALSGRVEHDRA